MPERGHIASCACILVLAAAAGAGAAASFATSSFGDGIPTDSVVRPGDPLIYQGFLLNRGDADGIAVRLRLVLAPCIDLSGFDPLANPLQVQVSPGPATVTWDAPGRTLEVTLTSPFPPGPFGDQSVTVSGLAAGAAGACCQSAWLFHRDDPAGIQLRDSEITDGSTTCVAITGCAPLPGSIRDLKAVRRGNDVDLVWGPASNAVGYNLWEVVSGNRGHVRFARALGALSLPEVSRVCATAGGACTDTDGVIDPPSISFYRAWGTCADGSEGDVPPVACGAVANVAISGMRSLIPAAAGPDGSCAAPGSILPVGLSAAVSDAAGNPLAGCPVLFYVDYTEVSNCGRGFGEFCAGNLAFTDASGVARASYTMRQEDFDFCNCLPSACNCLPASAGDCDPATSGTQLGTGLCPDPARCAPAPTCRPTPPGEDLFCQVAIRAASGAVASGNVHYLEYSR